MADCRVNKHFPFLNAMGPYIVVGCSCGWFHPHGFTNDPQGNQSARIAAEDHRGGAVSVFTETSRLVSSPAYAYEVERG